MRLTAQSITIVLIALLPNFLTSCQIKSTSRGEPGTVVIVADEWDRPILQPFISRTFEREIMTPQVEHHFTILWKDASQLGELTHYPLIIMAGHLEGEGPTARMLKQMIKGPIEERVRRGELGVFRKKDPWALRQLLLVVVGTNRRHLGENLARYNDSLYHWAYQFEIFRLITDMFRRGEQVKLERELERRYGFTFRIQHDYILAEENDTLHYWRLLRHHPERWVMVAWGDLTPPETLTAQMVWERRKQLGLTFYDPVTVLEDYLTAQRTVFQNQPSILIRGLWATLDPTGGGPFFSYAFADTMKKRYYIIDGAVFAPGERKMPYLWQVDAIAHTFRFKELNN
ncbi:MAG: DUF4837 family protein [bacterium]